MSRKFILLFSSMLSVFSSAAFAVGLGEYQLNSGHNQPLKATIQLLSVEELGEHELLASLASAQEFDKVGVERLLFLNDIKFKTERNQDGGMIVRLSSRQPIKEPFLNFLVELNWPNGRIIREYTFLLDPPIFEESTSSTLQKSETNKPEVAEPSAPPARFEPSQSETPTYSTTAFSGSTFGPVAANDTLWSIANRTRPNSQVSIHQTLVAIYKANPHAFADGNINNLLRGEVLQIPDADTISQVPHRAALQDVVMQNRQWQSGGARRIVDNAEGRSASAQKSRDARLTLAAPEGEQGEATSGAGGLSENLQQTKAQLVRSQEVGATLQAENEELRARLAAALEKLENVAQGGAAVDIADTELAVISQSPAEQTQDEPGNPGLDLGDTDSAEESGIEDTQLIADPAANESSESTLSPAEEMATEQDPAAESSKTELPKPKAAVPTMSSPVKREVGFLEQLMESGGLLWGGILGIAVLIAFAVFWRMRKRMEEEDFQDDLVASAGAGSMDTTESFELPDVGDDMLVELDMDEGESSEEGDENFDPLGEADIYIAYGKYEQAENLLLEAIDDNPIRSDLKVKLMECYAESEDQEKFEGLAQEVSQAVDAEEWQSQIDSLRAQAWSSEGETESEEGFDLPSTEDIFGEESDDFETELDSLADDDLGASGGELSEEFEPAVGDEDEFDIDMDLGEKDAAAASSAATETFDALDDESLSLDENAEDFALDIDEDSLDIVGDDDALDLDDADDISLDIDDEDFSFDDDESDDLAGDSDDGGDEISTKLDLARAYIDMGDSEGAREILAEVVAEGDEAQKSEAQALLDKAE